MPQSQTWPVSCNDTSVFQKIIKSMKYLKSYRPETIFLFLETVTLTLTPPAPKLNLSCILWPVYQKMFQSLKPFWSYHLETIFLFLVTVTLILNPQAPKSNSICILWCYIYVPKRDYICKVFHELSSGNHFSIFSNTDLDIEPTSPKVELDLCLVMLHLCPKKGLYL